MVHSFLGMTARIVKNWSGRVFPRLDAAPAALSGVDTMLTSRLQLDIFRKALRREIHAAQEGFEAGVGAQRIERGIDFDPA